MRHASRRPERRFIPALPTLDPRLLIAGGVRGGGTFPLDCLERGTARLFYLARAGVYHAVGALAGERGVVLMPAYHHGVEVEAVRATGARIRYYAVGPDLRIDVEDLARRMRAEDVRLVYVTHYAGFAQPIDEIAGLCRSRGVPVFEDCALALLSRDETGRPLGSTGAAAVFCLYKSLPVPHGGLLVTRDLARSPKLAAPPLYSTIHHLAGLVLAHAERETKTVGRAVRAAVRSVGRRTVDTVTDLAKTGTQHLSLDDLSRGASGVVSSLVARFEPSAIVLRRRRNFTRLAAALCDLSVASVIGAPLAPGACPLFLPVRVAEKPSIHRALLARGIEAIDFWREGDPSCDLGEFPHVAALRREVLELPCHQALDDADIDWIAQAAREEMTRV